MDLRSILRAEPAAIAEAVRQVLLVLVLLNVVTLSNETLAAIGMAVSAVLTLFVRQTVYSPQTVGKILNGEDGPAGPSLDIDEGDKQ